MEEYGSVEEEWCSMKKWLLEAVEEALRKKKCGGEEKVGGMRKFIF